MRLRFRLIVLCSILASIDERLTKSQGFGSILLSRLIELLLLLLFIQIDISLGNLRSGAVDIGELKDNGLLN